MAIPRDEVWPRDEFWDYSIALYARKEVARACLGLQRRHGIDVNLLLFCLWLAASGRGAFREGELSHVLAAAEAWHRRVVRPLRALRQWLKGEVAPAPPDLAHELRRRIAAAELDAEHIEQLILARSLSRPGGDREPSAQARDAAHNLSAYLSASAIEPSAADETDVRVLLAAAFPETPPEQLSPPGRHEG